MDLFWSFLRLVTKVERIQAWPYSRIPRGIRLETDLQRVFSVSQRSGSTLFDVGANIGQTMQRLKATFPAASVYCFEPIRSTFLLLQDTCQPFSQVQAFQIAVGDTTGSALMEIGAKSEWSRIVSNGGCGDNMTETVTICRLDDFCNKHEIVKIDLLKTDCEGYDLNVIRGAERLLTGGKVAAVYCEVNFERNGKYGDFFAIEQFLHERNYTLYGIYDYSHWAFDIVAEGFANALFVHKSLCGRSMTTAS